MARTYLNFDLVIAPSGSAYEVRVAASPAGEAAGVFEPPFSDADLENFRLRSGRGYSRVRRGDQASSETARDVGRRLYAAAFGGTVGERLRASLQAVRATGDGLRLRVSGPPELGDLPWEYLYSPESDRFLAISTETPIVRYLAQQEPVAPLAIAAPLNVLVVMASPADYPGIEVEREWAALSMAVGDVERRGLIRFDRLEEGSLTALQRQLRRGRYHIVHFIGHGAYDARSQEGMLILEGAGRKGVPVSATRLGVLLHDHPTLRLVVLNACEGGRAAPGGGHGGAAQALVRARIPGVIAMQFEISNEAATTFAEEFYRALVDGYPVDAALAEARKAIYAAGSGMEWGTQVFYTLSPDTRLFLIDPSAARDVPGPLPARGVAVRAEDAGAPAARRASIAERPAHMPVESPVVTPPAAPAAGSMGRVTRGKLAALLVLVLVFAVNLGETALEGRWSSTVTDRGLELASALHWFERGSTFENHDATGAVSVYGYSLAYFVLFPMLVLAVAWTLARHRDSRPFRTFAFALATDYALSLPFFLLFPVPERWAYPDASAILLSDLWDSRLIEAFRPMSALDNCFPSFHTSMTVVLVLCCFLHRLSFRVTTVPLGAMVVLSTYALGVHWVGDVIAGIAIGLVSVAVACRLAHRGAPSIAPLSDRNG